MMRMFLLVCAFAACASAQTPVTDSLFVPTNVHVTSLTSQSITLEWNKVEGAAGYRVWYGLSADNLDYAGDTPFPQFQKSHLIEGGKYVFSVSSVNDAKESIRSAPITCQLPSEVPPWKKNPPVVKNDSTGSSGVASTAPHVDSLKTTPAVSVIPSTKDTAKTQPVISAPSDTMKTPSAVVAAPTPAVLSSTVDTTSKMKPNTVLSDSTRTKPASQPAISSQPSAITNIPSEQTAMQESDTSAWGIQKHQVELKGKTSILQDSSKTSSNTFANDSASAKLFPAHSVKVTTDSTIKKGNINVDTVAPITPIAPMTSNAPLPDTSSNGAVGYSNTTRHDSPVDKPNHADSTKNLSLLHDLVAEANHYDEQKVDSQKSEAKNSEMKNNDAKQSMNNSPVASNSSSPSPKAAETKNTPAVVAPAPKSVRTTPTPAAGMKSAKNSDMNSVASAIRDCYTVQIEASRNREVVEQHRKKLHARGIDARIEVFILNSATWYRLRTGNFADRSHAISMLNTLRWTRTAFSSAGPLVFYNDRVVK